MFIVHTILICRGYFLGNVRVMMSIVYAAARALPASGIDRHAAYGMDWSPSASGVDRAH
jgi:hypothetical protein